MNMTKLEEDSSSLSPLLQGREKEAWRLLRSRFDLEDALTLLGTFFGSSRFTRRATHGTHLDQSHLDQFYLGDNGWWLNKIIKLTHVSNQTLLDMILLISKFSCPLLHIAILTLRNLATSKPMQPSSKTQNT